jgi:DNA-binding SARP family transcriptional activator
LPRDVLMETFWPETTQALARNSLNVALHGLRQAFKSQSDVQVIEFTEGSYRFNPQLRIWLDVDEFDRRVKAGHQLEEAGKLSAVAAQYEMAAGLYQGDFLPDEPYEEWAVLPRERLRLAHLDMLDRLIHIYFSQGHYASCATLCQLILAQDSCREDAHCRLMRCYSRQSQYHLSVRQYETCASSLFTELGIKPSAATTQLVERIRHHEHV